MPKLRPFVTSCIPILADRCPLTLADTLATSLYEKTARIVPRATSSSQIISGSYDDELQYVQKIAGKPGIERVYVFEKGIFQNV
jgi:hypothetical protein